MDIVKRKEVINKYYFDNYYPKLDILEKKNDEDSKQSEVKLCINYTEFLNFLKQTGIILQTQIGGKNKIQYKFLSYPNYIVSGMDEYLLNRLKITKDEREIGMLINTQNLSELWLEHEHKYHVGNDILPEYIAYLYKKNRCHSNDLNPEYFVRMLINDIYRWIKIEPIIWNVDKESNQLISDNITFQFSEEIIDDNDKCVEYINNILYSEMNYHPEQYLSDNILYKMIINYQLYKHENCLKEINGEIQTKILKKTK